MNQNKKKLITESFLLPLFHQHPSICTDTRKLKPGDIFFALHGPNFDGNAFAARALENGAVVAVVDKSEYHVKDDKRYVLVPDTLKALQDLARRYRLEFDIPFLAITGHLTLKNGTLSIAMTGKAVFQSTISTLRVADARASEAFYRDNLGFKMTWEYDPGDGHPVFLEVARDNVAFHLSEHEGDGPEKVSIYVNVADAESLYHELKKRGTKISSPLEDMPWGHKVFTLEDLDGNILRIGSPS